MRRAYKTLFGALLVTCAVMAPGVSSAASAPHSADNLSLAYNSETDQDFRIGMQTRMAWTGDYAGGFDGDIAASSLRAIRDFQARHGMEANGIIDEPFLRLLIVESDKAKGATGFQMVDDTSTGIRIGLPLVLVRDNGPSDVGRVWRSEDQAIEIETVRIVGEGRTLDDLYAVLKRPTAERSVTASAFDGSFFTIAGVEAGRSYTMRFSGEGSDLRGFAVSYSDVRADEMRGYVTVAANLFDPFGAGSPDPMVVADERSVRLGPMVGVSGGGDGLSGSVDDAKALFGAAARPRSELGDAAAPEASDSSGSGFIVSKDGWILTNAHVAGSCKTVLVGDHGPADKVVLDAANDLALVHVGGSIGTPLKISLGVPRLGEDVLALGFPLRSILADSLNVTRGNVSSLLGLMNDPRYLQISAPIQPGNSGGPLIDLAGRVVGVVTAKLNAVAVADATGDIPQSINFAIRPDAAVSFLEANGVSFLAADADQPFASVADTTASVQNSVLPILCLGKVSAD